MNDCVIVTGSAGFIGSNFVRQWIANTEGEVVSLDALTYAGNRCNLASLDSNPRHTFVRGDIADAALGACLFERFRPRAILHFAAESHVDRSISAPNVFLQTNLVGTFALLKTAKEYWEQLPVGDKKRFRFLHVSTDEVYGTLGPNDPAFSEATAYAPNSPYAATKAGSDHLVRAYHHTYGLPTLTTNCSNNYGPFQFPEKLIPHMILNALEDKPLPVYGDGLNVRDWLFVEDHCTAIRAVLEHGSVGETYNIGGNSERANLQVVQAICDLLDELRPNAKIGTRRGLITHVKDRPGHDRRYAINSEKIQRELGWQPAENFESGIRATVSWYLEHLDWVAEVRSATYQQWVELNYTKRLSL